MARNCQGRRGRACPLCPGTSDINLFCYRERIVDFDAEIADRTLDLRVAEQKLGSPKVSRSPVDQSRFRSSQRMRAKQPRIEPDTANPFGDQTRVLARRHGTVTSPAARE